MKHLREQPGFSWNEKTSMVEATAVVWDAYLEVRTALARLRFLLTIPLGSPRSPTLAQESLSYISASCVSY